MSKLIVALFLYAGLAAFFGVIPLALLSGTAMVTAVFRGAAAAALFATLGGLAGLATRRGPRTE